MRGLKSIQPTQGSNVKNSALYVGVVLGLSVIVGYFYVTVKELEEKLVNSKVRVTTIEEGCRISDQDRGQLDRTIYNLLDSVPSN